MPKHAGLTLGVASLVGTTVGFLVLWKFLKNRRSHLCSAVDHRNSVILDATGHDADKQCSLTNLKETPKVESSGISVIEKILVADIEIVSKSEEWEAVWLLLKKDLDVYPVLGMDCEWVSVDGKAGPVSLLQMASYSGFCVLVRLPQLTSSGCTIPKTLLELLANNIVPHEYRRHFPVQMKDHNSHDVLLLCTSCHAVSNYYDSNLKQKLAEEFNAPIGCEEGVRLLEDPVRRQVRSAARALLNAAKLPECRKEELISEIRAFYNTEDITEEIMKEAAGLETRIFNETYTPHGLKVVQKFALGGLRALMELEKRWRQHFLDTMHPKHLPQQWSVDHNHRKLLKKYGDDLVVQLC
uniref:Chromosome 14 open reading frame 114 n=1 Tax=Xenopus tropicalis TaxID=8364 RepID=Q28H97_XENTR|nr:chromosome 14 open reading frame 114 [Xenopus tropicalis]